MKKLLLLSLVTVLAVSLVGCNGNDIEVNNPGVNPGISGEMNNNENNNEEQQPEEPAEPDINGGEFDAGEENEEPIVVSELEGKINTLVEKSEVQVRMPMPMPIEAESALTYIGLTEEQYNTNVKEAIAFESMIMPSNFSLCLIELNDSANAAEIKKAVIDNCDLNKWICAWADKAIAVDSGKYIMLVMSTAEDCDALLKAFTTEFGEAGEVLSKVNDNI